VPWLNHDALLKQDKDRDIWDEDEELSGLGGIPEPAAKEVKELPVTTTRQLKFLPRRRYLALTSWKYQASSPLPYEYCEAHH
jgi:hypothetical protein